jgi:protein-tyrosine kinase
MTVQPLNITAAVKTTPPQSQQTGQPSLLMARRNRLPEILSRLNTLSAPQIEKIYARALQHQEPFGKAAINLGLATTKDVKAALAIQFGYHFDKSENVKVPPALVAVAQPFSHMAEGFRLLRTELLTSENGDGARLISIAGAGPGTGSSLVAANLAVSFAQLGRRTLLIDARLRNPQQARLFATKAKYGLEDLIEGTSELADALAPCCIRNLSLLAAPARSHDPQAILSSEGFAHFIGEASHQFDSIVIDTTTGTKVADGRYVWALTKSVLLVARKNNSRVEELRTLTRHIQACGANAAGTVMMG